MVESIDRKKYMEPAFWVAQTARGIGFVGYWRKTNFYSLAKHIAEAYWWNRKLLPQLRRVSTSAEADTIGVDPRQIVINNGAMIINNIAAAQDNDALPVFPRASLEMESTIEEVRHWLVHWSLFLPEFVTFLRIHTEIPRLKEALAEASSIAAVIRVEDGAAKNHYYGN